MTLNDLHSNEIARRKEFPIAEREIFLANAAICPLPNRVGQAMRSLVDEAVNNKLNLDEFEAPYEEARRLASRILGCRPKNLALLGPTSIGLSLVANGLKFERGDNIVYYHDDYPSNAVVWMNLEKRGVNLRRVRVEEPGFITVDDLKPLVDQRTRLVALSSAHFMGGYRIDLDAIGEWARSRGVLFCVDGIQTVGALETSLDYVDFLSAGAHKWLLGPTAIGLFYVNPEVMDLLEPSLLGWNNVICPEFITPEKIVFKADAGRYEAGCPNLVGLLGFLAALEMLNEFGIEEIERTVVDHTRRIREGVRVRGYTLACSDDDRLSGISTFRRSDIDMAGLYQNLTQAGVVSSLRTTPDERKWIRYSPHCYNTTAEIDAALELL